MDKARIEAAVREILLAVGENPDRVGLKGTPHRVAEMYAEVFSGIGSPPAEKLSLYPAENTTEMIIHRDIPFYSMCEHHLLPFWGFVSIAYIPKDSQVTGFSSLSRVVRLLSQRPQLQESMTTSIADTVMEKLQPMGAFVVILAQHLPNYLVIMIPRLVKNSVSTINPMQIIFIRTGIALQIVPMIIRLMEQIQLPMMFLSCTTATTILKLVLLAWVVLLIILLTILPKIV